eukprot:m.73148 g.73148  ORF g.73148 m.73148 type:complete len:315 (+) comp18781_c0_seq1:1655-2599(+)
MPLSPKGPRSATTRVGGASPQLTSMVDHSTATSSRRRTRSERTRYCWSGSTRRHCGASSNQRKKMRALRRKVPTTKTEQLMATSRELSPSRASPVCPSQASRRLVQEWRRRTRSNFGSESSKSRRRWTTMARTTPSIRCSRPRREGAPPWDSLRAVQRTMLGRQSVPGKSGRLWMAMGLTLPWTRTSSRAWTREKSRLGSMRSRQKRPKLEGLLASPIWPPITSPKRPRSGRPTRRRTRPRRSSSFERTPIALSLFALRLPSRTFVCCSLFIRYVTLWCVVTTRSYGSERRQEPWRVTLRGVCVCALVITSRSA